MAWIFIAYLCGLDLVIFGMGAEPFYVPDTGFEIDGYDQPVVIAFDVEYIFVAPYIKGVKGLSIKSVTIQHENLGQGSVFTWERRASARQCGCEPAGKVDRYCSRTL
jgi:hypothetical protein